MRRTDQFWRGVLHAQWMLGFLVFTVIVLGAFKEKGLVAHVAVVFGTLGTFLGAAYAARAYVDGRERNPDLHRALGERHDKTGVNPTPARQDEAP